jgi:hypothetical protein
MHFPHVVSCRANCCCLGKHNSPAVEFYLVISPEKAESSDGIAINLSLLTKDLIFCYSLLLSLLLLHAIRTFAIVLLTQQHPRRELRYVERQKPALFFNLFVAALDLMFLSQPLHFLVMPILHTQIQNICASRILC